MDFDWKGLVGTVAPTIATALGGPLAGMAVKALTGALGLPEAAGRSDVVTALRDATPDQLLAIRKADADFAVRMRELDIDVEKIAAQDRASARDRETKVGGMIVPALACTVLGGFFAMIFAILFGYAVADNTIAGALVGYVSAKAEQVIAYYFGSSAGSKRKTEALAGQMSSHGAGR